MSASLVVSIAGTTADTLDACHDLATELDRRSVPLSLLIASNGLLAADRAALDWVTGRTSGSDALVLHGFDHGDYNVSTTRRLLTGGVLVPGHEASLKLISLRTRLDALGLHPECFAPAHWVIAPGALGSLRRAGFRVCAELHGVRDLHRETMRLGRVIGFGQGEHGLSWRCLAVVMSASRTARRGAMVRLAVDGSMLVRPGVRGALLDAVDIALHHGAAPATYLDLVQPLVPGTRAPRTTVTSKNADPALVESQPA
jgi:predicted deacetylase